MFAPPFDGSRVRIGIAGDGIVFAVELARPLAMRRIARAVSSIYRDFDAITRGLVDDAVVLRGPRRELRLSLIQFPGAHKGVLGEAHSDANKAQGQGQYDRSCFHVSSCLLARQVCTFD